MSSLLLSRAISLHYNTAGSRYLTVNNIRKSGPLLLCVRSRPFILLEDMLYIFILFLYQSYIQEAHSSATHSRLNNRHNPRTKTTTFSHPSIIDFFNMPLDLLLFNALRSCA